MASIRLGITTQTPPFRFVSNNGTGAPSGRVVRIDSRHLGKTPGWHPTPGGVCRMILPNLRTWTDAGWVREAQWLSLQPVGPRRLDFQDLPLRLHHLSLPRPHLQAYARTKEKLWNTIHGISQPHFDVEDFRFYSHYNWFNADKLLQDMPNLDLAWVHDFQLLLVGPMVGLAAPCVFRWHIPFQPSLIPPYTRNFLLRSMEDFDTVIVSTRRDLEGLHQAGFRGVARQVYPHMDRSDWPHVAPREVQRVEHDLHLKPDEPVVLVVARMDPIKRQDLAIRALARIRRRHRHAKLVLVGNGSFSSEKTGLGLSKGQKWARRLRRTVETHKLGDAVVFAHWIRDRDLAALYQRAQVVALPSRVEGFGLTVLEGWRYGKPCIVSDRAGVAEVVHHGYDGLVFPSGNMDALADRMDEALSHPHRAEQMGAAGQQSLRKYEVGRTAPQVREILEDTIRRFQGGP